MRAEDKKEIYGMLQQIDSWIQGVPSVTFGSVPQFTDDRENSREHDAPSSSLHASVTESSGFSDTEQKKDSDVSVQDALDNVAKKIRECQRCSLAKTRKKAVPGMGVIHPTVLVIGEGPGGEEDIQGLPFVGPAGQLLDKMLAAINLSRHSNCFIANIVKCRPPGNRDPLPEECHACRSYLDAQIDILKPRLILCMGRVATQNLLQTTLGIGQLRGKFTEYNGIPCMATYHPSALLRNQELKRPAWEDLKVFRERLQQICPGYEGH